MDRQTDGGDCNIPNAFLKKCGDKNRSEVKVKVKVTTKWYAPIGHPKKSPHTKFVIPTSNNIGDIFEIRLFLKLGQGHSDPITVSNISPSRDASIHQIWDSYPK